MRKTNLEDILLNMAIGLMVSLAVLFAIGCPKSVPYVPPPILGQVSQSPSDWNFQFSQNMPAHPSPFAGGAWQFQIPGPTANVQYLNTPFTAGNVVPTKVSVTFEVLSTNPVYNGKIDPACNNPATFHLWLERRGDDGTQDYYRWWSAAGGYVFGSADNKAQTLTVPLTYDQWTSVFGHQDAAQFAATLANLQAVGMTFGGTGGCWGHGMDLLSGSATFELMSYTIQ